ncbi:MAG: hypothetical protein R3312_04970 [Gammaproteobacteria bacterium]|nr:hypothetical protein [Gammaproteobacteria bacterium]
MAQMPSRQEQIITAHAALIVKVATTIQNSDLLPELQHVLKVSEENGWVDLVAAIRRILNGERELAGLIVGLDEEDSTIIEAILRGIQNPETLPDPNAQPDASMAAPGLAAMIMDATRGNAQALELLANMAEQMTGAGGDMARLGGIMRRLVEGERNPEILTKGMSAQGESLVLGLLEELGKLEAH